MTQEIDLFLTHLQTEDIAPGTYAAYRADLRIFSNWLAGRAIAQITPMDIKQYRDTLKKTYKPSTINRKLAHLSAFFNWCVSNGLIQKNPGYGCQSCVT